MKITIFMSIKDGTETLQKTLDQTGAAMIYLSEVAAANDTYKQKQLHDLAYHDITNLFNLHSQVAFRLINTFIASHKQGVAYHEVSTIRYDYRSSTFSKKDRTIKLWVGPKPHDHKTFEVLIDPNDDNLLDFMTGEIFVFRQGGEFFLTATSEIFSERQAVLG